MFVNRHPQFNALHAKAFKSKKIRTVTIGKNVAKIKANAFKGSPATTRNGNKTTIAAGQLRDLAAIDYFPLADIDSNPLKTYQGMKV